MATVTATATVIDPDEARESARTAPDPDARVDTYAHATWRYLRGTGKHSAATPLAATLHPTTEPFEVPAESLEWFAAPIGAWLAAAACADAPRPDLFDADTDARPDAVERAEQVAAEYCAACPVAAACAAEGRNLPGVWGGRVHRVGTNEAASLKRKRHRDRHAEPPVTQPDGRASHGSVPCSVCGRPVRVRADRVTFVHPALALSNGSGSRAVLDWTRNCPGGGRPADEVWDLVGAVGS